MTVALAPLHGRRLQHRRRLAWIAVFALTVAAAGIALLVRTAVFEGSSSSTAAVQGSGIAITQGRHLSRFSSLELAGGNNITVSVGGKQTVTVRGDDNVKRLTVKVAGSGDLRVQRLTARDVTARISGSGRLQVQATRSLQASVFGKRRHLLRRQPKPPDQARQRRGSDLATMTERRCKATLREKGKSRS